MISLKLLPLLFATCHFPQDEIIVVPMSQPNSPLHTHDWIGEIIEFDSRDTTYVMHLESVGDTLFVESFENYDFSPASSGWGIAYFDASGESFLGDLTCGRWLTAEKIVINCNVQEH